MQLKNCPFCNGEAYLEKSYRTFAEGKVAFVRCKKCGASGRRVKLADFGKSSYSGEALKKAADLWNERANDG